MTFRICYSLSDTLSVRFMFKDSRSDRLRVELSVGNNQFHQCCSISKRLA